LTDCAKPEPIGKLNNLRSSSPHLVVGQASGEPRRNFAVGNFMDMGAMVFRSLVFGSGIRGPCEAVGGRRLARTSLQTGHALAAGFDIAPPGSSALFNRDDS
jgi:hypothetical protein